MPIVQSIHRALYVAGFSAAMAFVAGCDEIDEMHDKANRPPAAVVPTPVYDAAGNQKDSSAKPADANASRSATPADSNAATQPQQGATLSGATAGVGKQGQGYGGDPITQPVHEFFTARDRITFDIQIPKQMQIWKAMHNNRNPKNFAEYKKEILDECRIQLPELPPGKFYIYDAKSGELMVQTGGTPPTN